MGGAAICASHTPLLFVEELASPELCDRVRQSFARLSAFVRSFEPEQIIQFSPDHFHGFHYDNMPSFCVGVNARSYGDWKTAPGSLAVDEQFALSMLEEIRNAEIDASVSFDMVVDHGFVQIWEAMFGAFAGLPLIPVFVNCAAWPLPAYRRAYSLGQAVGRFAAASGKRILFAASGGLSHDPLVPDIRNASPELRERLIGRGAFGPEQQAAREAKVRQAALEAMHGKGPIQPLNPDWDRAFMRLLRDARWDQIKAFSTENVAATAGSGANEILCWVAAVAALHAMGEYEVVQEDYVPVPGWVAGFAHLAAMGRP